MGAYTVYYLICFIASIVCTLIFTWKCTQQTDVYYTVLFILIPISEVGYLMMSMSTDLKEALLAQKIIYFGGCFLQLAVTLSIFTMYKIKIKKVLITSMFAVNLLMFCSTLTIGFTEVFYKKAGLVVTPVGSMLINKEYGVAHTFYYVMIIVFSLPGIALMLIRRTKNRSVSVRTILLFTLLEVITIGSFFLNRSIFGTEIEIIPAVYVVAQIVYLLIMSRTGLYDVSRSAADNLVQNGENGFICFDKHGCYFGSNETAKHYFPELENLTIDTRITKEEGTITGYLYNWMEMLREKKRSRKFSFDYKERNYKVHADIIWSGSRIRGFQFMFADETIEHEYMQLIINYNTDLNRQVEEKTRHISEMQDKMILSFADMVENRDSSTGGHIKRTSEVMRILVGEMRESGADISQSFCACLIKAAPMHDLGKIAVDDAILRKPGRFTPEEFEMMKTHAAKGAEIVRQSLEGYDDEEFKQIAENVAHYHHERWDGSGYPDGLKGEEIPLEARIMAVADVYDALVSKRCYKESMSFEQANNIIMDGMGKHFDKRLEKHYVACRSALEAYYSSLG